MDETTKPKPRRQYMVTLVIEADDWQECMWAVRQAARHVETHGEDCASVMGGSSSSHIITIKHDPSMDNDGYFKALAEWEVATIAQEARDRG